VGALATLHNITLIEARRWVVAASAWVMSIHPHHEQQGCYP
jgi:hypothetical protein